MTEILVRVAITAADRERYAPPAPLPSDITPATAETLLGRWEHEGGGIEGRDGPSSVTVRRDGTWGGTDGCNRSGGRWLTGSDGLLLTTNSGSTQMWCSAIETDVTKPFMQVARAGFDGPTLVLYGDDGKALGRLQRLEP